MLHKVNTRVWRLGLGSRGMVRHTQQQLTVAIGDIAQATVDMTRQAAGGPPLGTSHEQGPAQSC